MEKNNNDYSAVNRLKPYLSKAEVWALSVGTSIGWGSLIVTCSSYLAKAGPLGSVLGLLIGAALMILIARNFSYMAGRYPDSGGAYSYIKNVFGYDRAFLLSWFLSLTYISMFWANATSLPVFARYFLNGVFSFGHLYTVFGYDVYLGEALLTLTAILAVTLLCSRRKTAAAATMTVLVSVFTVGICVCFIIAMLNHGSTSFSFEPAMIPDQNFFNQIFGIILISPWAFIGFENIVHSAEEFNFPNSNLYKILFVSIITSTALYIFIILLSITAYPPECASWLEYINNLSAYEGIAGLPAFYAAHHYLGNTGIYILMVALLALVLTSLIGNMRALSRLFYAVSRDSVLPEAFSQISENEIPANAMYLVALLSLPIPFLGRTAIGWIVDITTIGATMLFGFVSAAAYKTAKAENDKRMQYTGAISLGLMLVFAVYLLFPNLFSNDTLETETYILLIIWSILGFLYFRRIIAHDHARKFGKAIIVWVSLLALIVLMSLIWSTRREEDLTINVVNNIREYYETGQTADADSFINEQLQILHRTNSMNSLVVTGLFTLALAAMLINHFSMRKWETQAVKERDDAREVAYKDSLTGVNSKHAYVEHERKMAEKIYDNTAGEFAIVVCDVNGLKQINDTLGHKAGDSYIQAASTLICDYFKHSPVFRIGGDEFAIILEGRDYEYRHEILDELNREIESNIGTGNVVASLGMAEFDPKTDNTFHNVFTRADSLMYERKQQLKSMGAVIRD